MQYYSTKHISPSTDLRTAVLKSLPPDNGLYMPEQIHTLDPDFIRRLAEYSLPQIALEVISNLIDSAIPKPELKKLIDEAYTFPVVVQEVGGLHVAELWHGPTLAFKDFGARFMSRLFSYFLRDDDKKLTILTATSGDTGGAVAAGFFDTPNIDVIVLYPKGKVSDFQERQITTWGNNISAIAVDGTFDDCQRLVKQAFLDDDINRVRTLSSANSINLARLIPQTVYYFEAIKHLIQGSTPIVVSVPSGNFGNITAGVIAQKMGLPISHFIAATNANNIVPEYLQDGQYEPRTSIATLSNAMDVGNPSNFPRLMALHGDDWATIARNISGYHMSDAETLDVIREVYASHGYVLDPHSAIGYQALRSFMNDHPDHIGVSISTAHPIKFESALAPIEDLKIDTPESTHAFYKKEKKFIELSSAYGDFKEVLLDV